MSTLEDRLYLRPENEGTTHAINLRVMAARRLRHVLEEQAEQEQLALPVGSEIYDVIFTIATYGEHGYRTFAKTKEAIFLFIAACRVAYGEPVAVQEQVFERTLTVLCNFPLRVGDEHYHMPLV